MLRDNFGYNGSNPAAKELVETINAMAKLLNNITVDMGANGGVDAVQVNRMNEGINIDMSNVYFEQPTPPVP